MVLVMSNLMTKRKGSKRKTAVVNKPQSENTSKGGKNYH